jgi:hypothetical protein
VVRINLTTWRSLSTPFVGLVLSAFFRVVAPLKTLRGQGAWRRVGLR